MDIYLVLFALYSSSSDVVDCKNERASMEGG